VSTTTHLQFSRYHQQHFSSTPHATTCSPPQLPEAAASASPSLPSAAHNINSHLPAASIHTRPAAWLAAHINNRKNPSITDKLAQ